MLQLKAFGQKISYTVPGGLENKISPEAYRTLVDTSVSIVVKHYRIDYVEDGTIQLESGQNLQAFNLNPLIIGYVMTADKTQWVRMIHDHFDRIILSANKPKQQPDTQNP